MVGENLNFPFTRHTFLCGDKLESKSTRETFCGSSHEISGFSFLVKVLTKKKYLNFCKIKIK
jgi:hypothetical protein